MPPLTGDPATIAKTHLNNQIPLISEIVSNVNDDIDEFFSQTLTIDPQNEEITKYHTEPITITPLTREIPIQCLKTGKNSFKFYAYAPLEIPSGLIPTLNEGILAFIRK